MPKILAVADIGSNTMHMIVASYNGKNLVRIENISHWLGLGEIVGKHGFIPPKTIKKILSSIREFRELAIETGAKELYVFATAAMRAAKNNQEIIDAVEKKFGIEVDLIDQKREAELGWLGAKIDSNPQSPTLFLEVGGGSIQIAYIKEGYLKESISLPIGTGRLKVQSSLEYPVKKEQTILLENIVEEALAQCQSYGDIEDIVASGGVSRGIMRALHKDGDPYIHLKELDYLIWSTQKLIVDTIVDRFCVKQKRAGTLLPGSIIVKKVLNKFNKDRLFISEYGVREGAIFEIHRGNIIPCRL